VTASRAGAGSPGALVVCPTPIGNLDDVTLRVLAELRRADVVACEDTRRTRTLLARHGIARPLLALHEHNEAARAGEIVDRVRAGERVALVSDAGLPAVSDPGARLVAAVADAGLSVSVLPGPSAVTTALVASGLAGRDPATSGFVFAGFLPRGRAGLEALLERLDATALPLVPFESPRRLPATLAALVAREPARRVAVCRELTKLHEEVARGTAEELAARFQAPPRGEVTLVLAPAAPRGAAPDRDALAELGEALGARRAALLAARLTGVPRNRLYAELTGR
jgi:16S rRNA (cytidine1402-2'-O)-methyltransferase